jgi:hypothetical protein
MHGPRHSLILHSAGTADIGGLLRDILAAGRKQFREIYFVLFLRRTANIHGSHVVALMANKHHSKWGLNYLWIWDIIVAVQSERLMEVKYYSSNFR